MLRFNGSRPTSEFGRETMPRASGRGRQPRRTAAARELSVTGAVERKLRGRNIYVKMLATRQARKVASAVWPNFVLYRIKFRIKIYAELVNYCKCPSYQNYAGQKPNYIFNFLHIHFRRSACFIQDNTPVLQFCQDVLDNRVSCFKKGRILLPNSFQFK